MFAPSPGRATLRIPPGVFAFCMCTTWNAAAQARATLSVSLMSSEEPAIVGVEMRKRGSWEPVSTQTACPTGMFPP